MTEGELNQIILTLVGVINKGTNYDVKIDICRTCKNRSVLERKDETTTVCNECEWSNGSKYEYGNRKDEKKC